ncbi:MAG: hypothetical protein EBX49_04950 [Synechococcaceae bacterium WB8_1B_136]|nr:hypothetical protein [Synechococcaceae bacterium WB8_1B_136]
MIPQHRGTHAMPASTALLSLQDSHAPYKGVWQIFQAAPGSFEAVHSTYRSEQCPGCVIEQRRFSARGAATAFARHLMAHGWNLRHLHGEGEHFWFGLPDAGDR